MKVFHEMRVLVRGHKGIEEVAAQNPDKLSLVSNLPTLSVQYATNQNPYHGEFEQVLGLVRCANLKIEEVIDDENFKNVTVSHLVAVALAGNPHDFPILAFGSWYYPPPPMKAKAISCLYGKELHMWWGGGMFPPHPEASILVALDRGGAPTHQEWMGKIWGQWFELDRQAGKRSAIISKG